MQGKDTKPQATRAPRRLQAMAIGMATRTARRAVPTRAAVVIAVVLVVVTGAAATATLVWTELERGEPAPIDWPMFGVMAALLLVCEWRPQFWIRTHDLGLVTPRWLFSFGLLLIGSPSLALAVTLLGVTLNAFVRREPARLAIVRLASSAASLAIAGIVLQSFDIRGSITTGDVSWWRGVAIIVAGAAILLVNTFVNAIDDTVRRSMPFTVALQRGAGARLTAEGALLSLAPIWVIGIDFSLVLLPLLGVTTVLVFRSTRQALEHARDARHDALTGLLNRRAFRDELTDALGGVGSVTVGVVMVMDLDGFKEVNDRLGHEHGDRLLVALAGRLREALPAGALVARLGGDEFAVLVRLPGTGDAAPAAEAVARGLHDQLTGPLVLDGLPVSVGVSIGLAMAPANGRSADDLVRAADVAMYRAKRAGTGVERYDRAVPGARRGRVGLLGELATALDGHELIVRFQPQLRLADGQMEAVEALTRWEYPAHGSIPPSDLIGLAERTDLIGPITELVLRMAINGVRWAGDDRVRLAVDVSARSLHDPRFAPHVLWVLEQSEFPPHRVELEVAEQAVVTDPDRSTSTIAQLRHAGVRIAIDAFGSGYSSYQTLRQLDVDRVKIDRELVTALVWNPRHRAVVQSVIALAHRLGLDVVADGVESTAVWDALGDLGCDAAQGDAIAHPFPELRGWTRWNELHLEELVPSAASSRGRSPIRPEAP